MRRTILKFCQWVLRNRCTHDAVNLCQDGCFSRRTLAEATLLAVLGDYLGSTSGDSLEVVTIVIHRRRLLRTTLLAINEPGFSFLKKVQVVFAGEDGDDFGGPRR